MLRLVQRKNMNSLRAPSAFFYSTFTKGPKRARKLSTTVARAFAAFLFGSVMIMPVEGEVSPGAIGGITRDSGTGKPIAQAQIVAHSLESPSDRAAFSDAAGSFSLMNLEPGAYEVVAEKNGFEESSAKVNVTADAASHVDLSLQAVPASSAATKTSDGPPLPEREKELQA